MRTVIPKTIKLSSSGQITKNFLSLSVGQIVGGLCAFLAVAYAGRTIGVVNFGKVSFALALIAYFMLLTDLGLQTMGIREVAKDRERASFYIINVIIMKLLLWIFSAGSLVLLSRFLSVSEDVKSILLIFTMLLLGNTLLLEWFFQGVERMEFIAIGRITKNVAYLLLVLWLIKDSTDLYLFAFIQVITAFVPVILLAMILLSTRQSLYFTPSLKEMVSLLRISFPMGLSFIVTEIHYNLGTMLLGFTKSEHDVGLYAAASRIVFLLLYVAVLFAQAVFPSIARLYVECKEKLQEVIIHATKVTLLVALPLGIGGTLWGKEIIAFVFSKTFSEGGSTFQILIWVASIIIFSSIYRESLLACGFQKQYLLMAIAGLLVNVVLNLILIPLFSFRGAAMAFVVAEAVILSLALYFFFRHVQRIPLGKLVLQPLIALFPMGVVIFVFRNSHLLTRVALGGFAYLISHFGYGWWREAREGPHLRVPALRSLEAKKEDKLLPKVYIIVLNWNGHADTIECIQSLQRILYENCEIVIVDNGSSDESEGILRRGFPEYKLVETGENLGFAGGNNAGIRYALTKDMDYVLLLNNDTVASPTFLSKLIDVAEASGKECIVGPKIYYYDNPNRIWFAGGRLSVFRSAGLHIGINKADNKRYTITREVDFLTGCCWLMSRKVIEKVGLLDERFFMFLEDVDYCIRVKQEGLKLIYTGDASIWHKGGASGGPDIYAYRNYHRLRSTILLIRKHHSMLIKPFSYAYIVIFVLQSLLRVCGAAILRRRRNLRRSIVAIIQGTRDGFKIKV